MQTPVQGKNVIVRAYNGVDEYIPWACATTCSLTVTTELIPVTTVGNGKHNAYRPRFTDSTLTLTGISFIQTDTQHFTVFDSITEALRNNGLNIEISFTDDSGNLRSLRLFCYIPLTTINGDVEDFSDYEIELQASGAYDIDDFITPTTDTTVLSFPYSASGGELSISDPVLVGRILLAVHRETVATPEVITTGTPGDKQVKYTTGLGKIDFPASSPLNPGEFVLVIYK